jgi:serpin B
VSVRRSLLALSVVAAVAVSGHLVRPEDAGATPPHAADDGMPEGLPRDPAAAGNAFFVDLWRQLGGRSGNLVVSPTSVWSALQLVQAGARGETASALAEVTRVRDEATADAVAAVHRAWNRKDRPYTLRAVDRVFVDERSPLSPAYLQALRSRWGASAESLPLATQPSAALARINGWVAEQTAGRIPSVLGAGDVGPGSTIVLVDAVYLLARWATPFDPKDTIAAAFRTPRGTVRVPTMARIDQLRLVDDDPDVRVLELPYEGGDLVMSIVLPRADDGLAAVEARLDLATLDRWTDMPTFPTRVDVRLPKLQLDADTLDLVPALRALGLEAMFDPARADLGGLLSEEGGARPFVSAVKHRAFVKVDEVATEVAAATGVSVVPISMPAPLVPFHVDHPFLFLIRDLRSGLVLFAGRVTDPS